jgi:putative FmdB family regulatory protein
MPTYEYRCPEGHTFELFQRITDPAPDVCDVCGAGPVERVLHPVAVHFKGSGFYATDYGKGKKKRDGKEDGGGDGKKADEKPKADAKGGEKASSAAAD